MNKNSFIAIIIVVVAIAAAVMFVGSDSKVAAPDAIASAIMIEQDAHDFGDIDIFGGKVETDFVLTNTGDADVIISDATTSCGCTEGVIDGMSFGMHQKMSGEIVIAAGESKNVTAIYDPLAHGPDAVGPITRQLFLKTNSSETPKIELRVSANVFKNE